MRALLRSTRTAPGALQSGLIHQSAGHSDEALAAYSRALALQPTLVEALVNMGPLLHRQAGSTRGSRPCGKRSGSRPKPISRFSVLAACSGDQGRVDEAVEVYRKLLHSPAPPVAAQYDYCNLRRHIRDWDGLEEAEQQAVAAARRSGERVQPSALAMACSPEDHLALARTWAKGSAAQRRRLSTRQIDGGDRRHPHRLHVLGFLPARDRRA